MRLGSEVSVSRGNVLHTQNPEDADGEIAQAGHHPWPISLADLRAILIVGDVPYPVNSILDPPMASDHPENLRREESV